MVRVIHDWLEVADGLADAVTVMYDVPPPASNVNVVGVTLKVTVVVPPPLLGVGFSSPPQLASIIAVAAIIAIPLNFIFFFLLVIIIGT